MFNERTIYSAMEKDNTRTSITTNKFDADILQVTLENVHAFVQTTYDMVTDTYPQLSRRKRGDLVRILMSREAEKKPIYYIKLNQLL